MLHRGLLELGDYEGWIAGLISLFGGNSRRDIPESRELSTVRFNVQTFLRALYLTLVLGMKNIKDIPLFEEKPGLNDELGESVLQGIREMDKGLNYPPVRGRE